MSNLPTVWTNALAGTVLAGGETWTLTTLLAGIGLSLLYVSGMYLNDAFDREIDAKERPDAPDPGWTGSAQRRVCGGFGLMLAGLAFVLWACRPRHRRAGKPMLAALGLAAAICSTTGITRATR